MATPTKREKRKRGVLLLLLTRILCTCSRQNPQTQHFPFLSIYIEAFVIERTDGKNEFVFYAIIECLKEEVFLLVEERSKNGPQFFAGRYGKQDDVLFIFSDSRI